MSFAFGFTGDDIESDGASARKAGERISHPGQNAGPLGAFPIQGKPQLPPKRHDVQSLLHNLPSKIAYDTLNITLDDDGCIKLPRRELWDIRMQVMAEDEDDAAHYGEGLGDHDVKTGVYEGGFKSWESSIDLVKVLSSHSHPCSWSNRPTRIIELGCGTALPSLALFQWVLDLKAPSSSSEQTISFILADYNPSVLQLVTLPNLILTWALHRREALPELQEAFSLDGELELSPMVLSAFQSHLSSLHIEVSLLSGGWSRELVELLYTEHASYDGSRGSPISLLLGAETVYSPFALHMFTEMVLMILEREASLWSAKASAWVAAKSLYFGVGGSLDDFVTGMRGRGAVVVKLREDTEGVRRGVIRCSLTR